jgi:hypothetical protein
MDAARREIEPRNMGIHNHDAWSAATGVVASPDLIIAAMKFASGVASVWRRLVITIACASAICGLEASDYRGHSLYMLKRIATALERRIEIRFVPVRRKQLKTA